VNIVDKIIRSATYEGMADELGNPTDEYIKLYESLARKGVKHIITGFMFVSNEGRAMHKNQAGLDTLDKIGNFKKVTEAVHKYDAKIYAQIAHTGRQTTNTGYDIVGISNKKSPYFCEIPRILKTEEIYNIIDEFANSACIAKQAGFDGIQLHAAHGYLIHQFMLKVINNRDDEFREPFKFLELIIRKIHEKCNDFPIWIKVSGGVDIEKYEGFIDLIKFLDTQKIELIEVSYGTMDYALNIFRGNKLPFKTILKHNPIAAKKNWLQLAKIYLKLKKYTPQYNLEYAHIAKQHTIIPISVVGGFRSYEEIENCKMDYVSICRPLICEPDLLLKENFKSKCTNCNLCAVMVDSNSNKLRCYHGR